MEKAYLGLECQINHRRPQSHLGWSSSHVLLVVVTSEVKVHTLWIGNKTAVNFKYKNVFKSLNTFAFHFILYVLCLDIVRVTNKRQTWKFYFSCLLAQQNNLFQVKSFPKQCLMSTQRSEVQTIHKEKIHQTCTPNGASCFNYLSNSFCNMQYRMPRNSSL